MKRSLFVLLLCFTCYGAYPQAVIKGRVVFAGKDKSEGGINVTLQEKEGGAVTAYAVTGEDGRYELKYRGQQDSVIVSASGFNVKKQSRKISGTSQTFDFLIEEEKIEIREVVIHAPKIRQSGDTLNYHVGSFTDAGDRTIGDVLKKMPGIQVAESGEIRYQNKPINKFYIENLDLLKGRYGIATNNIEAKDVSTVQVLENHQPVKALKDIEFVEEAAINLKLKDEAKGVFLANMQLGAGAAPLLLSNELVGMYFAGNRQNMSVYKGDNSGRDVGRDLTSFYNEGLFGQGNAKMLSVRAPSPPSISEQRRLFNDAHQGTVNELKKLANDYTLTLNATYLFDRPEKTSHAYAEYYLPGDTVQTVSEKTDAILYKSRLNASAQVEANKDRFYLKNETRFHGEWDRERGDAVTDGHAVLQHLRNPSYRVENSFELTKRKGEEVFQVKSVVGYKDFSQTLSVSPVLYGELFGWDAPDGKMLQEVDSRNFTTANSVSWGGRAGPFRLRGQFGFNADLQQMNSVLFAQAGWEEGRSADSLRNDLRWDTYEWILAPSLSYVSRKLNLSFRLPLKYMLLDRSDRLRDNSETTGIFYVNPSLYLNYSISPMWKSSFSYGYTAGTSGIQNAYTGYVMSDYRSLLRNDGEREDQKRHNLFLNLSYKNPLTALFGSLLFNYANIHSNLLDEYEYQGILRIKNSVRQPHTTERFSASGNIGKDLHSISVSLGGFFGFNTSAQISQGELTGFRSQTLSLSPSFVKRFGSIANLNYKLSFARSKSDVDLSEVPLPVMKTLSQRATLNLSFVKNLVIGLSCEYFYNNMIEGASRSMWFGDVGVKYKWKKMDLMLDYTNVFNTKRYVSSSYSDISRYLYSYKLRPAEVLLRVRFKLK